MWARTYDAHLPAKNIDELRQLVEAGAAEEAADARHAIVVAARRAAARRVTELGPHAAELENAEQAVRAAQTLLPEQDGAGRFDPDRDCDGRDYRKQQDKKRPREGYVEHPLRHPVAK